MGYLMPELSLYKDYLAYKWMVVMRINTFPEGICWKVNVLARLDFRLVYKNEVSHDSLKERKKQINDIMQKV